MRSNAQVVLSPIILALALVVTGCSNSPTGPPDPKPTPTPAETSVSAVKNGCGGYDYVITGVVEGEYLIYCDGRRVASTAVGRTDPSGVLTLGDCSTTSCGTLCWSHSTVRPNTCES